MTRIEREPASSKEGFKPGAEIHWRGVWRDADVAKITVHVTGGNVHAPTQSDRKVREVAANANPLLKCLERCPRRSCVFVSKSDLVVHKIANCLNSGPSGLSRRKPIPSELAHLVGFAVSAPNKVEETFIGQVRDRDFGGEDIHRIRQSIVFDNSAI